MNVFVKSLLDIDVFFLVQVCEMFCELVDVECWLEEVEVLLVVECDFVLVYLLFLQEEVEGDQQVCKCLVLWFKENCQCFVEYCWGILFSVNGQLDNFVDLQQLVLVLQVVYGLLVSVVLDLVFVCGMVKVLLSGLVMGMNW